MGEDKAYSEREERLNLAAYEAALKLVQVQASLIWASFTAILAANAFLLTIGAALLAADRGEAIVLSAAGIIVCFLWFLSLRRHYSYYDFYFAFARSVEEKLFSEELSVIRLGNRYGLGETDLPGFQGHQMPVFSLFRIQWVAWSIIAIVAFAFGLLGYLSVRGVVLKFL